MAVKSHVSGFTFKVFANTSISTFTLSPVPTRAEVEWYFCLRHHH